jgi:hypothetical protein
MFPLTGYFPFFKGAAAYRFFIQDAINFERSLRVAIGFGANEDPMFRREFSKPGSALQLSSTVYWYQVEPHAPLPAMVPAVQRAPAPEEPFWPDQEKLPSAGKLKSLGVKLPHKQKVLVAGDDPGTLEKFQDRKWPDHPGAAGQTADGKALVRAVNARNGSNALISIIEWVEK